jgi:hypothetical protein
MAKNLSSIKRIVEAAASAAAPQGVRGPLRGKDFMLDDLTHGADRDGR